MCRFDQHRLSLRPSSPSSPSLFSLPLCAWPSPHWRRRCSRAQVPKPLCRRGSGPPSRSLLLLSSFINHFSPLQNSKSKHARAHKPGLSSEVWRYRVRPGHPRVAPMDQQGCFHAGGCSKDGHPGRYCPLLDGCRCQINQ